ncbi:MAG: sugar-binding protein [Alistipes sp.]|nr:sugar-binding protein [Alistipes sp.]
MKKTLFLLLCAASTVASCSSDNGNGGKTDSGRNVVYELTALHKVFGFDGQKRYAYCPSVMTAEDGTTHVWFCGNPTENVFVDNIYHLTIAADGTVSEPESVLQPSGAGTWDSQHVCDPSVVKGEFLCDGHTYSYAMFYLGSSVEYYYNEIGVAFADDPNAATWVKYGKQLVTKTWSEEGEQVLGGGKAWGVGQPSAFSVDGRGGVILTYTVGDRDGTRVVWRQCNLSDMSHPDTGAAKRMTANGFGNLSGAADYTRNMDFMYDAVGRTVYAVRPLNPCPTTYPSYIGSAVEVASIPYGDFRNGTGKWTPLVRVNSVQTGFPRTHNAALERDAYGRAASREKIGVYYTVSRAEPLVSATYGNHAEWSYAIWCGSLNLK